MTPLDGPKSNEPPPAYGGRTLDSRQSKVVSHHVSIPKESWATGDRRPESPSPKSQSNSNSNHVRFLQAVSGALPTWKMLKSTSNWGFFKGVNNKGEGFVFILGEGGGVTLGRPIRAVDFLRLAMDLGLIAVSLQSSQKGMAPTCRFPTSFIILLLISLCYVFHFHFNRLTIYLSFFSNLHRHVLNALSPSPLIHSQVSLLLPLCLAKIKNSFYLFKI